jgi:linoleoyl-CoA desaturase
MFAVLDDNFAGTDPATGRRRGLKTAIATVRGWRRDKRSKKLGGKAQTTGRADQAA